MVFLMRRASARATRRVDSEGSLRAGVSAGASERGLEARRVLCRAPRRAQQVRDRGRGHAVELQRFGSSGRARELVVDAPRGGDVAVVPRGFAPALRERGFDVGGPPMDTVPTRPASRWRQRRSRSKYSWVRPSRMCAPRIRRSRSALSTHCRMILCRGGGSIAGPADVHPRTAWIPARLIETRAPCRCRAARRPGTSLCGHPGSAPSAQAASCPSSRGQSTSSSP